MSVIRVEAIQIDSFRRFSNITIPFGKNLTIIAGQNGTAKSTLLGMLAQPFSFGVLRGETAGKTDDSKYTNNYHGLVLDKFKDIAGNPFMYNCDRVFRISNEFDFGKEYQYKLKISLPESVKGNLPDNFLVTKSHSQKTRGKLRKRFVTGPGASHKPGEGNFPHPVIYLGLNRLWPLAVAKNCTFSGDALSKDDKKWYVQKYNEILCLEEHDNNAKFMDTLEKKRFITPHSSNYDGESCSAGQDNLSQILTAIISFRRLKKDLGVKYQGGLLLIDELDATLHAYAQEKFLELLCKVSEELDLQIIATSHSLFLLGKAFQSSLKKKIKILYLENKDGKTVLWVPKNYQEISDHLKVEATPAPTRRPRKVSVVFEDDEGKFLFNQICGSKLRDYIHCPNKDTLGGGHLKNLAYMSKSLPELQDMIFVPDGDMAKEFSNPPKNLLVLPGDKRPETLIYQHLRSMNDSDPFWREIGPTYSKQYAITKQGGTTLAKGDDKAWVKDWYKKQGKHWGRGNNKAFKSWVEGHKPECLEFCKNFLKLLKVRYRGDIPKNVIDKVLAQFKDT